MRPRAKLVEYPEVDADFLVEALMLDMQAVRTTWWRHAGVIDVSIERDIKQGKWIDAVESECPTCHKAMLTRDAPDYVRFARLCPRGFTLLVAGFPDEDPRRG